MAEWADYSFDFFISHAGEDKAEVAAPLAAALEAKGLRVWFDKAQLLPGDRLRRRINDGLRDTHCGIVVLSPDFMRKEWPQRELDALISREEDGARIIPILHELSRETLRREHPLLSDFLSLDTRASIDTIAVELANVAEKSWSFNPLYRAGEYTTSLIFPVGVLADAIEAIETILSPSVWTHFDATEDVSQNRTWMGSQDDLLIRTAFQIFHPLLIYAQRETSLERSVSEYDSVSRFNFEALRLGFETWTREYDLAQPHLLKLQYTPRTHHWRQLREERPDRYLLQGLNRKEVGASLKALSEVRRDITEITPEAFLSFYQCVFNSRAFGYKEIGLLFNPVYRYRPIDRPIFTALLMLWRTLWSVALKVSKTKQSLSPGSLIDEELKWFTHQALLWPDEHRSTIDSDTQQALKRFVKSRIPDVLRSALN